MKEGILFGMIVGMIAGAILVESYKPARDIVQDGQKKIKKAMATIEKSKNNE